MSEPLTLFLDFIRAICRDETGNVRCMLRNPGLDVNARHHGDTPFMIACRRAGIETMRCFLDCGRPIDFNTKCYGKTGIMRVIEERQHLGMVDMLVADPRIDLDATEYHLENNLLHFCAMAHLDGLEMAKIILASNRFHRASSKCINRNTPRHMAFLREHIECAELIRQFTEYPVKMRRQLQEELGYPARNAGELFATVVLLCDDYLKLKQKKHPKRK